MATHTVIIECIKGEFKYTVQSTRLVGLETPRLTYGDTLVFKCADNTHHFAVHFGWNAPFFECQYSGEPGKEVTAQVIPNVPCGVYKYSVAVFDGTTLWTDDPQFIIRP